MKRRPRQSQKSQQKEQKTWHIPGLFESNPQMRSFILWILAIIAALHLLVIVVIIPVCNRPRKELRPSEIEEITSEMSNILLEYNIFAGDINYQDSVYIIHVPKKFPLLSCYRGIRNNLESIDAAVLQGRRIDEKTIRLKIGKDNLPIGYYEFIKQPINFSTNPRIAIIIDDFGYVENKLVRDFLSLDIPLTISIIPGLDNSSKVADLATLYQKEVLLHLPMEPKNAKFDVTPYTILVSHKAGVASMRVRKALASLPTAVGVNNHMGSKATENRAIMRAVLSTLRSQGKFFIDSRTSTKSIAFDEAQRMGVPSAQNQLFLDAKTNNQFIRNQFLRAAHLARQKGQVVAIGHARESTFSGLTEMISQFHSAGIQFVNVSELVH